MPNLQIGRVGDDIYLAKPPRRIADRGGAVTIEGQIRSTTPERSLAAVHQLRGYNANPDERRVPVRVDEFPDFAGFYVVDEIAVDLDRVGYLADLVPFSASLRPIALPTYPQIESIMEGGLRSNGVAIATSQPWHALPDGVAQVAGTPSGTALIYSRLGSPAGGGAGVSIYGIGSTSLFDDDCVVPWRIDLASFYNFAATLLDGDGFVVVGRRHPLDVDAWTATNYLTKVAGNSHGFAITTWDLSTSAWGLASTTIQIGHATGVNPASDWNEIDVVAVETIRCAPEEVVVKLAGTVDVGGVLAAVDCLVALRRGARLARLTINSDVAANWGIRSTDSGANWTDDTSGAHRSSADTDGNTLCAFTSKANDVVTTGHWIVATADVTSIDVGVGYDVAGGDSQIDPRTKLRDQYFAWQRETQVVAVGGVV